MDDIEEYGSSIKQLRSAGDDEIRLVDYLTVALKYRRMILGICGIAMAGSVIFSLLSPKIYSATATLVPPLEILPKDSRLVGGLGTGESSIIAKAMAVTGVAELYIGLLSSRVVEDAVIDQLNLMESYGLENQPRRDRVSAGRFAVRKRLRASTTIEATGNSIVSITVRDTDPNRAAAVANAYVEELDSQNKRLSTGQATNRRLFLQNRLKEIEAKLSGIDNILSREAKIQEMLFELLTREYEIAKIEEAKSMPTIAVLDRAIVPEVPVPRHTAKKTALVGGVFFVLAIFLAFARQYFAEIDNEGQQQWQLMLKAREQSRKYSAFSEVEGRRKIVAAQRKRVNGNFCHRV